MKILEIPKGVILPSPEQLTRMMQLVRDAIFPEIYGKDQHLGEISDILKMETGSDAVASDFVAAIPELRRLLITDVKAVATNDPAVASLAEVILSYPTVKVMIHYRTAHKLYEMGVPLLPRIITELAHSQTGIDIHPAAQIGEYFAIDHGTGVVIGETCIIGKHVMSVCRLRVVTGYAGRKNAIGRLDVAIAIVQADDFDVVEYLHKTLSFSAFAVNKQAGRSCSLP